MRCLGARDETAGSGSHRERKMAAKAQVITRMAVDPLLSDDLPTLLRAFPNHVLRDLVGVLKQRTSLSPFPAPRAYKAHALPDDGEFSLHADSIAREVLWWGTNDLHRQFGEDRLWPEVVARTAKHVDVAENERTNDLPAWKLENAVLRKALDKWERLTPEQREKALRKAGTDAAAVRGVAIAAVGGLARLGTQELLALLAARGAAFAVPVIAPFATAVGVTWAAYDLAGPGYRALLPATLIIAFARRRLRDERAATAFRD